MSPEIANVEVMACMGTGVGRRSACDADPRY